MNDILKKLPEENEDQYIWKVGQAKDSNLIDSTWEELTPRLNTELGIEETEWRGSSAFRKAYRWMQRAYDNVFRQNGFIGTQSDELDVKTRELKKEIIKLRDERTDYQKSLREDARRESFLELVERTMVKSIKSFDYKASPIIQSDDDMIVCLSDLHAGIECDNYWNTFNTDILRDRLYKYIDEIISIQNTHQCKICNVVLGGDNISGWIHRNLRLQNNENVIEQVKVAVTYIAHFVHELQPYFEIINVYSVSGNHSRLSPSKDEQLTGEELDALIPFCLNIKFENNQSVNIVEDSMIDNTIGCMTTRGGKVFYLCHGDKDTPKNVVQKLTLMTGTKPHGIIMGHRHHNSLDTEHNVKIIQCGCVVGMDDYCIDKRISGEPEQCVVITNSKRTVKCLYDIGLN